MANALTYTRTTKNEQATARFGASLAPLLRAGDVVLLSGDLGAGKTHFVQGVASALRVAGEVTSPTYTILMTHPGRMPLYHFDLYRLESAEELDDVDYWGTLEGDGVSFVEWGDRFPDDLPGDFIDIRITVDGAGNREFELRAFGERARRLLYLWADDSRSHLRKA